MKTMDSATGLMHDKIDELLVALEDDSRRVRQVLSRLDELRGLVIKRDEAALGKLLETIGAESDTYSANESKRQSIRKDLADALDCTVEDMTLSRLESMLSGEKRSQVAAKKAELKALTGNLKTEHLRTAMLLSDCARFNSVLLRSVLELGQTGAITYGSNGATKHQTDTVFVNMQF